MICSELLQYPKLPPSLGANGTKRAVRPSGHEYSSQVCEGTWHQADAATQTQAALSPKASFSNAPSLSFSLNQVYK